MTMTRRELMMLVYLAAACTVPPRAKPESNPEFLSVSEFVHEDDGSRLRVVAGELEILIDRSGSGDLILELIQADEPIFRAAKYLAEPKATIVAISPPLVPAQTYTDENGDGLFDMIVSGTTVPQRPLVRRVSHGSSSTGQICFAPALE